MINNDSVVVLLKVYFVYVVSNNDSNDYSNYGPHPLHLESICRHGIYTTP